MIAGAGRAAVAGLVLGLAVFAVGFLLGAVRTVAIAPATGALAAVALELPVILIAGWVLCGAVMDRFAVSAAVPAGVPARLVAGETALVVVLGLELLTVLAFGGAPRDFVAGLGTPAGLLGLSGQILFSTFPLLQALRRRG